MSLISKIFGNANVKAIKKFHDKVELVNSLEGKFRNFSDEQLQTFSLELKEQSTRSDESLINSIACIREAIKRTTGEWAYDVQIVGALALNDGSIAEMKTGEGKTLVATICLYINYIFGNTCHLVTVNDYLSRRDAQWYGKSLQKIGLKIAVLQNNKTFILNNTKVENNQGYEYLIAAERKDAYQCDVVYGTNSEFGFDYLRDNMRTDYHAKVQRDLDFVIVDEVDSVLIDEARTPLIISGEASDDLSLYPKFTKLVRQLSMSEHYEIDETTRNVLLTVAGIEYVEKILQITNLYSAESFSLLKYLEACLRAESLYKRDKDYVVKDRQIIIVDTFTGRLQEGRRWSDGLHQAIEAKEGLQVQQESMTYATITIQNYFRIYKKLSGMTGTAVTEAEEFAKIYDLDVYVIPTNLPTKREDLPDLVYTNEKGKFDAVVEKINQCMKNEIPVLVGTSSIDSSEKLSELLTSRRINHEILNAKNHEKEAGIIAKAGFKGSVTIATNMAGRGTDIKLGPGVVELGGLHVIGTERHESRRIDNQLRGRSGRQGDPGITRIYVSFDDELMRRFAPDWLAGTMEKIGMDNDTPIESKMVTRSIETAQTRVESNNFEARKYVLEYDDVMNIHRSNIYNEREVILEGQNLIEKLYDLSKKEFEFLLSNSSIGNSENYLELKRNLSLIINNVNDSEFDSILKTNMNNSHDQLFDLFEAQMNSFLHNIDETQSDKLVQFTFLSIIDNLWVQHLTAMNEMKRGIGLRAYGQMDPLIAFKNEALSMWEELGINIRSTILRTIVHQVGIDHSANIISNQTLIPENKPLVNDLPLINKGPEIHIDSKVGRNDQCPCGSSLKYKKCHGLN